MNIKRRTSGSIELHLSDDPDQFTFLAEAIRKKLAGRWTKQAHGLDQSYWDLDVQGKKITVHREHYIGVVISATMMRREDCCLNDSNAILRRDPK